MKVYLAEEEYCRAEEEYFERLLKGDVEEL